MINCGSMWIMERVRVNYWLMAASCPAAAVTGQLNHQFSHLSNGGLNNPR